MPLIITPAQLERRAELYHQVGILLAAGMTLHQSLEQLTKHPPSRPLRLAVSRWLDHLNEGCSVTEAVGRLGRWMPAFDLALVEAGEKSGRLDACFKLLSTYYTERAQMARQVISDLLYPLFILHFAVVLFPFIQVVQTGNVFQFVRSILMVLGPLYAAVFLFLVACQGRHGEMWRGVIETFLRPVPLLGTARRYLALARLSAALEALLNAGVSILGAWELAANASGSPAISREVRSWKVPLENGSTPSELVSGASPFPDVFRNLYHTGEISGTLDDSLKRLRDFYQQEGSRKMRLAAQWTPRLIYFGIVIYVGIRILSFYAGYFQQLNDVMDMK
jgi:general secretion pathway protein F/type IV pilus assembly protein PilC